ncbi:hypothetical protein CONLIGDRAFT_650726 [Coniochaeta ligniaria NRRL 30616]|uniref:Uncharacterized protein n=1 Tax=Coniochaeta ligniaria NRRL 30616 TaxID=1408157 RepID=A0A1J7I3K1_9PEZI|nr:hypothetical protein CONLIGDRAFT_650726 [Coniochaeta ligniaria NRRL 30616]
MKTPMPKKDRPLRKGLYGNACTIAKIDINGEMETEDLKTHLTHPAIWKQWIVPDATPGVERQLQWSDTGSGATPAVTGQWSDTCGHGTVERDFGAERHLQSRDSGARFWGGATPAVTGKWSATVTWSDTCGHAINR